MATFLRENKWQLIALTLAVVFLYAVNMNGSLLWDDNDWITNNPFVHSLTWSNISNIFTQNILAGINGTSNYYRPLLLISILPNYLISGTNPFLYHVVNDVIHLIDGILIYYLLLRWLGKKRIAFLASLLFVIHPLQTEAVAYIVGRADPLSVFFILSGILLFINRRTWFALISMVLAILTRETGILFPIYLGIVIIAFEYSGTFWKRFKHAFIKVLPFLGISVIYGLLRLTILNFENTLNFNSHTDIYTEHILYRIYTFFDALALYIRLIFWPTGLHFSHDIPVSTTFLEGSVWLGGLFILASIIWLFWLYKRKNVPAFNVWFFGLGIFFTNLSLSSGIVATINARALEHWLYFSLFGAFAIIAWYLEKILLHIEIQLPRLKILFIILFIVYCIFLGYQTIRRNLIWNEEINLYKDILKYEPNDYRALNNVGSWYYLNRDSETARQYWTRSIASNPYDATAYSNLGYIANDEGRLDEAEKILKNAITIDPSFYNAYRNLIALYIQQNRFEEAKQLMETMKTRYPKENFSSILEEINSMENSALSTSTKKQ